jgi:hypothetical protein
MGDDMYPNEPSPPTGADVPALEPRAVEPPSVEPPTVEPSPALSGTQAAEAASPTISEPAQPPVDVVPVAPSRRGAARWGIALAVTAVVVGLASVALFLVAAAGSVSPLAKWVPPRSYAYAELRTDLPGGQDRALGEFLSHFPGFDDQAQLDAKITETLDRLLGEATDGTVTYSSMKPWLGGTVALAATGIPAADEPNAPAVLMVAITDAAQARSWLAATSPSEGTTTETYGGAEMTIGMADRMTYAYAVLDTVLLAGDVDAVKAAIDTNGASAFASSESFKDAVAAMDGDHLGWAYVDTRSVVKAGLASTPIAGLVDGAILDRIPAWTSMALQARSDALEVVVSSPGIEGAPVVSNATSTIAKHLPADTLVAVETRDVAGSLTKVLGDLKAADSTKETADQLEQALGIFGGFESVVSWMGDASVAVTGSDGSVAGGLVVQTSDEAAASEVFTQLRTLLGLAGAASNVDVRTEPYGDGEITTVDLGDLGALSGAAGMGSDVPLPEGKLELAFTVQDGLVIIGVGDTFVKSVVDTKAGDSLADQPRYQAALDRAGSSNTGQAYVDIAGLVGASLPIMPANDRSSYEQELKPFVDPLAALAGASLSGEPMRVRFVLTVQ